MPPHLATPVHRHLQHAPSFSDSGSSYILNRSLCCDSASSYIYNTPPHLAIPFYHISETHPLICRFRFITYRKHGPSFAIPAHHISTTRPLICRFRFIIYLEHATSFGDIITKARTTNTKHTETNFQFRFIRYLKHASSFGHDASYTCPLVADSDSTLHAPSFGDGHVKLENINNTSN